MVKESRDKNNYFLNFINKSIKNYWQLLFIERYLIRSDTAKWLKEEANVNTDAESW